MTAKVRVLLWYRTTEHAAISAAYQQVSAELAGTAGLLGSELLHSADDPASYLILSEWRSLAEFRLSQHGSGHAAATAPLRQFQDRARPGGCYGVYRVAAKVASVTGAAAAAQPAAATHRHDHVPGARRQV